jgi:hypothetical protein
MRPRPSPSSDTATGPSAEQTAQAVVAAYIHSISERHRPSENPTDDAPASPSTD